MLKSAFLIFLLGLAQVSARMEVLTLKGSGTTNPRNLIWKLLLQMEERAATPLQLSYRAVGSTTGQKEFLAEANDFGATEVPLSMAQQESFGEELYHLPIVIGAISMFHNVPRSEVPGGLNLTATLLAKIFQRDIVTWDDPEIMAANPNLAVPPNQGIKVVHRKKGSSSTSLTTQYFSQVASDVWKLGQGTTIDWPSDTAEVEGSPGMANYITNTLYSIGYIDSDHGHSKGLSEIELQNKDGNFLTSKEADIGSAADNAVLPSSDGDWSQVDLVNQAGAKTWPIASFTYLLVAKNVTRLEETGHILKAFLEHAMSEGQKSVEEFGFQMIPQSVIDKNMAAINSLVLDANFEPFTFEKSTTAITGAGDRVISVKRQEFHQYQFDQTASAIKILSERIENLEKEAERALLELHGSGTTNPSKLHWKYGDTLHKMLGQPLLVSYRAVGSSTGIKEFMARVSDFVCSEIPLTSAQREEYGETVVHIPMVLGTISIFHNVPGAKGGLNLTATLMAKIFQRDIKTWDHAEILAENPNLQVPPGQNIEVMHRVKGSSSTKMTTQYLQQSAPETWNLGSGSTIDWPADTTGCEGSSGMSKCISSTTFSIGYIDTDHGFKKGLVEVELQNKDGNFLKAKEADIGAAAEFASLPTESHGNWENVNLIDQSGPDTWPMTMFSYMLVPQDLTYMGQRGALLKAYLQFMMSSMGQGDDFVSLFGFSKIPPKLSEINNQGIETLKLADNAEEYSFEWSTEAVTGMGRNTFSVKRNSYDDLASQNNTKWIESLLAKNEALEKKVQMLADQITMLTPGLPGLSGGGLGNDPYAKLKGASCKGRCGEKGFPIGFCYCDSMCGKQDPPDCCLDIVDYCPDKAPEGCPYDEDEC